MEPIESKVESLTNTILKTDAESWEIRNKAILQLTDLVLRFKDETDETINEHFTANVFRMLKEPIKNMVMSWRSPSYPHDSIETYLLLFLNRFWT